MPFLKTLTFVCILLGFHCIRTYSQHQVFLPMPTGSFSIGTHEVFIEDTTFYSKKTNSTKKLFLKIWYPSDSIVSPGNYNKYMEGYSFSELQKNFKILGTTKNELKVILNSITHSKKDIPISNKEDTYPLIIFTPGCYFGLSDIYSSFIENLASNGYIVCSITHIEDQICVDGESHEDLSLNRIKILRAFLQWRRKQVMTVKSIHKEKNREYVTRKFLTKLTRFNKIINDWERNTLLAINSLKQYQKDNSNPLFARIDFNNTGTMGQSLGGALANQLVISHDQFKAGVNLDCFQFGSIADSKISKPMMLIEGDFQEKWRLANSYIYKNQKELEYIKLDSTSHFMYSDLPFFDSVLSPVKMEIYIGKIDGKRKIHHINKSVLKFFDNNLRQKEPLIRPLTEQYNNKNYEKGYISRPKQNLIKSN